MVEAGIPHLVYLQSSPLPVPRASNHWSKNVAMGLPWWLTGGVSICQGRRRGFKPWSRKTPHARGQVSPRSAAGEPVLSSPGAASTEPTAETPRSVPLGPAAASNPAVRSPPAAAGGQPAPAAAGETPRQQRSPAQPTINVNSLRKCCKRAIKISSLPGDFTLHNNN